ncbi:hypothetical protein [Methylobacterium indicum]|uniref:hypothetical protein n=1 Tax=Methylobacterium indicum TaxID=1775910 RepID=UPI000734616C|nr:hypothetical protein [Methylobacterium indicum]
MSGDWYWFCASGQQRWSPGFPRLLGLAPRSATPSYALFVDLVDPGDRGPIARPSAALRGHVLPRALLRPIRPSGELRSLSVLSEPRLTPDGRPLAPSGVALDVNG